ncbi:MAG: histidinol-phosphatase HisJ family protein [Oscillospiraceae bacterium]
MIIFDSHSHSSFSHDATQTIDQQCQSAIEKGFLGIAITDHCELSNRYWNGFCKEHIPLSIANAKIAKENYRDKLKISVGIEIGEELYHEELAHQIIYDNKLDFVICSCHSPYDMCDYSDVDFSDETINIAEILDGYFDMLEQTSRICDFDSLAHLTYPVRYIQGTYKRNVDLSKYQDIIDRILENLIRRNKAMEVNTSGYRQKLGMPMPNEDIIKRYFELGGKLITVGSDAHRSEDMGKDFDRAIALIKSCGFDRYHYYENRTPFEILI